MSFTTIIKQFIEMKRPEKGRRIQHTAEIIGTNFSTSGQTGDEAVELLLKAVQEVLTGSYQPSFFQFRGTTIAIYRDAHSGGWMFAEMTEQAGSFHLHPRVYEHGPYRSKDDAGKIARSHIAQNEWDGKEVQSPLILDEDEKEQRDFTHWAIWQLSHRHYKKLGKSDHEAYELSHREPLTIEVLLADMAN
jgi:hypothetical protein